MQQHLTTIILALCIGFIGGYLGGTTSHSQPISEDKLAAVNSAQLSEYISSDDLSDTTADEDARLEALEYNIELLALQFEAFTQSASNNKLSTKNIPANTASTPTLNRPTRPNQENLSAAGVNSDVANKLLRRMSQQEYKRLELQNNIRRNKGAASNEYRQQLRELSQNKISLRSELGDETYDKYLFASQQNNRVKISSVMSGSPAESSGFESNDVILSYDNQKVLAWSDIRRLTLEGEIGSYTNVDILRDGTRMSLMVPRGTLGVQLEPVQLDPTE